MRQKHYLKGLVTKMDKKVEAVKLEMNTWVVLLVKKVENFDTKPNKRGPCPIQNNCIIVFFPSEKSSKC